MKKLFYCALSAVFALGMMTSCDKAENEIDVLGIYPIQSQYHVIYADQTLDSVAIESSKTWKGTLSDNWIQAKNNDLQGTVKNGDIDYRMVYLNFTPISGDSSRVGYLSVTDYENIVYHHFMQVSWLNIISPSVEFDTPYVYKNAKFRLVLAKNLTSAILKFTTYAPSAQLTTEADWFTLSETEFGPGEHEVEMTFDANTTAAQRTANIVLSTSNGFSNTIEVYNKGVE